MAIELEELFLAQSKLDSAIAKNHNISYKTTRNKRILALLVEIGEFANATRCFKYWSNKGSDKKEIVLDEYADGLHFFLSLGVDIQSKKTKYHFTKNRCNNLTDQILLTYQRIAVFSKNQDEASYKKAFQAFLNIIPLLHVRFITIKKAYFKKLNENYKRQENNY